MAIAERELVASVPSAEQGPGAEAEGWTPQPYQWTRAQFYEMGDAGLFEGQRVILVEGEILSMPAMNPPHQSAVTLVAEVMRSVFGAGFFVREQGPFDVGTATDPEPDVAVIAGSIQDFKAAHPTVAALIVEVSHTTLPYDRRGKASLYASAGIADYWIINISQEPPQVEVHRQPAPDAAQPHGFGYGDVRAYVAGGIVQPLAAPGPVAVSALLP